jgi:hypothetical protein
MRGPVKHRALSVLAAAAALGLAAPASAVVTATWTVETFKDFDAGDATDAFITSLGEVRPGWTTRRVGLEGESVWAAARLRDGSTLIATDEDASIYRVSGTKVKKVVSIAGAIAVSALAVAPDGTVYAGAMPSDRLWKIDVAAGKATPVARLEGAETIWSLAAGADGTIWAGTGPKGQLFAYRGGGAKVVYDTEDKRVTAVAVMSDGRVWFGTSDRALVFRHDPKHGTTRAMGDFAGNEITAIAELRGGAVVAANDLAEEASHGTKSAATVHEAEKPKDGKGTEAKEPKAGTKPGADKATPSAVDTGRKGAHKGKGALFWIGDDGRLDQLQALTATYYTSVLVGPDGKVYAGAADKGRIYMVDRDGSVATAFDVEERAVSQLWWDGKELAFATDDGAAMYRATGRASKAKYVSDVLDAKAPAHFGALRWQAGGKIKLETRTGNTSKPGPGWSTWQATAGATRQGGGMEAGQIASPPGRYLQFRAAFDSDRASLARVAAYYVPQNQATEIEELTIEPAKEDKAPTLKDSAAKPRSPVLKVTWKVENPDSDQTDYKLEVRRDGEADWRPIETGTKPLTATTWDWNTETFPDGWYRLRVTSSDAAANSPDRALESSKTTTLFVVDNQKPTIERLRVTYPKASATASDALSTLAEMAFSVDDGPWQLGTTADGVFDQLSETLRIDLPADLARGTHTLSIRVADDAGNVGATTTTFVKK